MEAVSGKGSLQHKPGSGGFVACPDGSLLGQLSKEPTDLHQIGGKGYHFRFLMVTVENCCRDRFGVDIKTNTDCLFHGWTPFDCLGVPITHVALAREYLTNLR